MPFIVVLLDLRYVQIPQARTLKRRRSLEDHLVETSANYVHKPVMCKSRACAEDLEGSSPGGFLETFSYKNSVHVCMGECLQELGPEDSLWRLRSV
eukprot:295221-Amphidinium_carterae.2